MSEIKGLVYNNDAVEFVTPSGGIINGDLTIEGDLLIDGTLNGGGGSGGGGGLIYAPMDLPDITFKIDGNNLQITWQDPDDTIDITGETLVTWAGTKVVYRTDHYASSVDDGTLLVNNTVRNQYKDTSLEIQNIDPDVTYYIQFFAYSTEGVYNTNPINWRKYGKSIYTIVDFNTGTDEEIARMLEAHYRGDINIEDYWNVGDTRKIHLKGITSPNANGYTGAWAEQDITIVITTLNHHDLAEPIGARDKAAVTLQTRECLNNLNQGFNENGCIFVNLNNNLDSTFSPWSKLPMRTWMNDKFYNTCFSDEWKALIKNTKHKRLTTYNQTSTEEVVDKIFLPSYPEIFGNTAYQYYIANVKPNSEEGTQWEWYKTSGNRIKKGNSNGAANTHACYWWMGSASSYYNSSDGYSWCIVGTSGAAGSSHGNYACGLAPAFAI